MKKMIFVLLVILTGVNIVYAGDKKDIVTFYGVRDNSGFHYVDKVVIDGYGDVDTKETSNLGNYYGKVGLFSYNSFTNILIGDAGHTYDFNGDSLNRSENLVAHDAIAMYGDNVNEYDWDTLYFYKG